MSAKLEWNGMELRLGRWVLAIVGELDGSWRYVLDGSWRHAIPDTDAGVSDAYERRRDCMQDCKSEVRRLLREAGVEVE